MTTMTDLGARSAAVRSGRARLKADVAAGRIPVTRAIADPLLADVPVLDALRWTRARRRTGAGYTGGKLHAVIAAMQEARIPLWATCEQLDAFDLGMLEEILR
jgi:hypothetical protein